MSAIRRKGPILVGKSPKAPGKNADGSTAEDMQYADRPAKSERIKKDRMFSVPDKLLNDAMKDLMTAASWGKMKKVALEMHARFASGTGGTYHSDTLDAEIANHPALKKFHAGFLAQLRAALKKCSFDPARITVLPMNADSLAFNSFSDKVFGLTITVNQVWSAKAELQDYYCDNFGWMGSLAYTLYDDFGLDWADVEKTWDRVATPPTSFLPPGACFRAWYILQHYRSARPFITEMRRTVLVGSAGSEI
jgi:hypothetical protein